MDMNCGNDGSGSLRSCQSNPNIMIEKTQDGKCYKLSLHSQNTWWPPNEEWIKCKDLCSVCESLPGVTNSGKNTCSYR